MSKTLKFILPHGPYVTIREQNGEDDDILSKVANNTDNTSLTKFLSRVIIDPVLTPDEIALWPVASKYYALLKSRIFSMGSLLEFKYTFDNPKTKKPVELTLEEDLSNYDADLESMMNMTSQEIEDLGLSPYQIRPYPLRGKLNTETTLSTGRRVAMDIMNSEGETKSLQVNRDELTINDELRFRNFRVKPANSEEWVVVENFREFTSREMQEIRKWASGLEVRFEMPMRIENPFTKEVNMIPLIALPDFFFPRAI
jgi:hypothetical protein